jgi:zinc protease
MKPVTYWDWRGLLVKALLVVGVLASTAVSASATNIERVVSAGGIEAWLVRDSTVPLVAMEFAFLGGAAQDPAERPGVANLITALLDEGAGELDAAAFQERMEENAIELRFRADRDHFRGTLRTLTERRAAAIDLLRLALNAPRFEASAIERIRAQVLSQLRRETTDPGDLASKAWWATAFAGHPYGRPEKGTLETVEKIDAGDLRSYVRRVFARDNLKVAIVGDIDVAAAREMLDQVFGGLPANGELAAVPSKTPEGLGRRVVVDLDVPQAVISLGGIGIPRKHPDFMAAFVVNHILGGGSFTSRLYQEVREKRGLAYGVSTYLVPMERTALFMGWTGTRADRTAETLDIIDREIRRIASEGPTEEELAKAKAFLKGSYPLRFDTSTKIAGQLVQIQIEDLGIDYIKNRNAMVEAVTAEDAKRAARNVLSSGLLVTVAGRPKGVTTTGQRS